MASLVALKARMAEIVSPVVTDAGYDLEELSVNRVGRRLFVRITVDGDTRISLDEVANLSRRISDELDASEGQLGPEPFTLEVSSPGVDRPLTEPRHWRRATGRLVKCAIGTGRVVKVTDEIVILEIDGQRREATISELGAGKVQVEFNRPGQDDTDDLDDIEGLDLDEEALLDEDGQDDDAELASEKRDQA